MHFSKQEKKNSYWIHMLHWTIDKTCSAQTHQTLEKILCPLRVSNKDWPVGVCHSNLCIGETVARVRSCVICMTEQVTVKENSSFSYRIPLMVWGPPALCRYSHQTTAKCGRLYKVVYPLSSCLCPPAYGIKPQPKAVTLLHMIYSILGEALLNTAFNNRSIIMPRSWGPMCACRETARALSLQRGNSHREQRENGKVIQEGGNPVAKKF